MILLAVSPNVLGVCDVVQPFAQSAEPGLSWRSQASLFASAAHTPCYMPLARCLRIRLPKPRQVEATFYRIYLI